MAAIKKRYAEAQARGDAAAMKSAHADAEALRAQYGYSGGSDGSDYIGKGYVSGNVLGKQMSNQLNSGFDAYKKYMEDAAAQQQAALKAKVDSAVASLNGQKYDVMKQTEANNAAAEKAYMQSIKPGGSNAETLAANGLLTSGLTESSQISAGNAYQNALNSNATTQTETLAKIEQAITQAQLTGDIEAANALANLYKEIAPPRATRIRRTSLRQTSGVSSSGFRRPSRRVLTMGPRRLPCGSMSCRSSRCSRSLKQARSTWRRHASRLSISMRRLRTCRLRLPVRTFPTNTRSGSLTSFNYARRRRFSPPSLFRRFI